METAKDMKVNKPISEEEASKFWAPASTAW